MPQPDLGTKLRALRSDRGNSIAEVSDATGISASFLSLVENGRSDIAIGRLMRLIDFYGVGLATLFPESGQADVDVIRRDDHLHLASGAEGLDLVVLTRGGQRGMTPFLATYEVGGGMSEPTPYEGEAFIYVLEGRIGVELEDGEAIDLAQGDSATIRSTGRRTYRNTGDVTARILGVIARPDGA